MSRIAELAPQPEGLVETLMFVGRRQLDKTPLVAVEIRFDRFRFFDHAGVDVEGDDRVGHLLGLGNMLLDEFDILRITSYNVCYTKLLRILV